MKMLNIVKRIFADESGSMDQMVWLLGSAVVVVLVVIILMANSQSLAGAWWTDITGYIKTSLGF
jgi:hypothetical protein